MPIYEYRCTHCGRYHQELVRSLATYEVPACPRCGATSLRKLVSRFAVVRSDDAHLADLGDDVAMAEVDERDPRSVARWARKMGDTMGEDLGPEFDEMVDRMEAGEMQDEMADGQLDSDGEGESFAAIE